MRNLMCCECTVASVNLVIKIPAVKEWLSRNVSVINASVSRDRSWWLENCVSRCSWASPNDSESATGRKQCCGWIWASTKHPHSPWLGLFHFEPKLNYIALQ